MKKFNQLAALFAVFTLMISLFLPTGNVHAQTSSLNTNVTIHKLQADAFNSTTGIVNENGEAIGDTSTLGTNVKPLADVTFTAYEITKEQFLAAETDYTQITDTYKTGAATEIGTTAADGTVTWSHSLAVDANGVYTPKYYAVFETKAPAEVTSSIAVPFVIAFPMSNTDGTTRLTDVHIYPKNITSSSYPVVGKDIESLGTNAASYNIGESFKYILKGSIPTNIQNYTQYQFNDTLDAAVTYVGNPVVTVAGTMLTNTEFTVTQDGQVLTVALTPAGIAKVAELVAIGDRNKQDVETIKDATDGNFIQVTFDAKLNDKAIPGSPVSNTATITYNTSTQTATAIASDAVTVVTGGKIFTKTDGTTGLPGAEFTLQENGTDVVWNADLLAANPNTNNNFVAPADGQPIKMISGSDGKFEIKGLAYSAQGGGAGTASTYTLTETKAPAGYALLGSPLTFTVDATSYTTNTDILNNKRPSIPQTGGIGSVIFVVLGLIIMFLAYRGYQKFVNE